jgi:hypothetical protein
MTHAMIDIETLDLAPSAIVLSIGCVIFSLETGIEEEGDFYAIPAVAQFGRTLSLSTKEWWDTQPKGLIPVNADENYRLTHALWDLSEHLKKFQPKTIWANGSDFDFPILVHAFRQCNHEIPWKYNAVRDARTMYRMFPLPQGNSQDSWLSNPTAHNALEDARYQAINLIRTCHKYDIRTIS